MLDLEELVDERKSGFIRMKELKDSGRKVVGTFCSFTPNELIDAAGAFPVSLCGSSQDGVVLAENVLPKSLCPLIKASYGFAYTDKCPYFHFADMILAETTCDGKKKMYELMGEIKPTHVMQLPHNREVEHAIDSWEKEIHRAKKVLEENLGTEITDEAIRRAIHDRNLERQAILEIYELGKLNPCPINLQTMLRVLDWSGFSFDVNEKVAELHRIAELYRKDYEENYRDKAPKRPRIMITGCPTSGVREKILFQIEESGADVVCFENCGGPKCMKDQVDETNPDPIRALAEKYLRINCSIMSPNSGRLEYMQKMAEEYAIDGIIEVVLCGCHTYAVEAVSVARFAKEELHIPYLRLEADFAMEDKGQIKTRLDAFVEMIG